MVNMTRIDLKSTVDGSKTMFGNILEEGGKEITFNVKYPEEFEGIEKYQKDSIAHITHGVYVPVKYRTPKKKATVTKRKTKGCGCK